MVYVKVKPTHEDNRIVSRPASPACGVHRSWEDYRMCPRLWPSLSSGRTTNSLRRPSHSTELSNQGWRALVSQVTKNPLVTGDEIYGNGRSLGPTDRHQCSSTPIRPWWWSGQLFLTKRHIRVCVNIQDHQSMRGKIFWSGEEKITLLGYDFQWHAWRKPGNVCNLINAVPILYFMLWGCLSGPGSPS